MDGSDDPATASSPSSPGGAMEAPRASAVPRLLRASYLANQEDLLVETRSTPLFYLPGPILFVGILAVLTYLAAAAANGWPGIPAFSSALTAVHIGSATLATYVFYLFLILLLVGLVWLLVRWLRWRTTVYAATTRRVIVQRGILARNFDEIPLLQVRGISVHQSVGQRVFGYGTIRVSSEGGQPIGNEDWLGIPHPFRFQKVIENAIVAQQSKPQTVVFASPGPTK